MTGSHSILLYDGTCGLCQRTVRFILKHDRVSTLRFASRSGEFGGKVLESHPELQNVDSVIWIDPDGEMAIQSDAALRIAGYLGGAWKLIRVFRVMPRSLRNGIYDLIARHRHRIMGSAPATQPTPELRSRFLD